MREVFTVYIVYMVYRVCWLLLKIIRLDGTEDF